MRREPRLAQMVRDHRPFLVRLARAWTRWLPDASIDAEDVVQTALEHLAGLAELPSSTTSQRALMVQFCRWACSSSRRAAAAEKRGKPLSLERHVDDHDDDQLPITASLEEAVAVREALGLVRDALVDLTPAQRRAVLRAAAGWAADLDQRERRNLASVAYNGRRAIAAHLVANGYPATAHHSVLDDGDVGRWRRVPKAKTA